MTLDEQIKDLVDTAKRVNGNIKITIKGDYNDADYAYLHETYSPKDFIDLEIDKVYKFFKTMANDTKVAYDAWFSSGDHTILNEISEDQRVTLENICNQKRIADRYKDFWIEGVDEFVPYTDCDDCEVHMINEATLELVIKKV